MSESSDASPNQVPSERARLISDREAAAKVLLRNRTQLLARIKRRIGPGAWSRLDPDEIFSSGLRRLDLLWVRGVFPVRSDGEFWALVMTVFYNAAIDKAKLWKRFHDDATLEMLATEGQHAPRTDTETVIALHDLVMMLCSDADRELLLMRLRGQPFAQIASLMGGNAAALRQRWCGIRRSLRSRLALTTSDPGRGARDGRSANRKEGRHVSARPPVGRETTDVAVHPRFDAGSSPRSS